MKYKLIKYLFLIFTLPQVPCFSQVEKLMGWANISFGMSNADVLSEIRSQIDYSSYQTPSVFELTSIPKVNVEKLETEFNGIISIGDTNSTGSKWAQKDDIEKNFTSILQLVSVAVNPINLHPPLSMIAVTPKAADFYETTADSKKIYFFIFHKDKLVASMWTANVIKSSKNLWEAFLSKYGNPTEYFMLTDFRFNGGGKRFAFASYPEKGVCLQLSPYTYDAEVNKSDLTLSDRYKAGDFKNYGRFQTFSFSPANFNFDKTNHRAIVNVFYWDTTVVSSINSEYDLYKKQIHMNAQSNSQETINQRSNDF